MKRDEKRRLTDNGDALLSLIDEVLPRLTKKQQERARFLLNTIRGKPNTELFPPVIPVEERLTTFNESTASTETTFSLAFSQERFANIDMDYYHEAVLDWSNKNRHIKRDTKGWLSTVRTFIRSDQSKGKLMMRVGVKPQTQNEELEYLKRGYGG